MTQSNNASADAVWQEHGDFQVLAVVGSFREHSQQDMHPIVSEYTNLEQCGPFLLSTRPGPPLEEGLLLSHSHFLILLSS